MAATERRSAAFVTAVGDAVFELISSLGDFGLFAIRTLGWLVRRRPARAR